MNHVMLEKTHIFNYSSAENSHSYDGSLGKIVIYLTNSKDYLYNIDWP